MQCEYGEFKIQNSKFKVRKTNDETRSSFLVIHSAFDTRHSAFGVRRSCRAAFSLLEMLFVFILIGLLAGLVTVNARHYLVKGKQNAARAEISSICTAIETFNSTYGRYPTNEENLAILSQKSEKFPDPLLKQIPIDPWGHPYQYNTPGKRDPYEVITFGADGHPGGSGADADISSTNLKESPNPK